MATDSNAVAINGWIRNFGIWDGKYPRAWIQLEIPRIKYPGGAIDEHRMFMQFNVPKTHEKYYARLERGQWLTTWEAFMDSHVSEKDGKKKEKRTLRGSLSKVDLRKQQAIHVNHAVLVGACDSVRGDWYRFGMSYLNPLEKDPRKKWKIRYSRVWAPEFKIEEGRRYLILGSVAGIRPQGQEDTVLIAKLVTQIYK